MKSRIKNKDTEIRQDYERYLELEKESNEINIKIQTCKPRERKDLWLLHSDLTYEMNDIENKYGGAIKLRAELCKQLEVKRPYHFKS